MSTRHPIHCIIPPHVLDAIAENGSDRQKALAAANQATAEQFRSARASVAAVATAAAGRERVVYTANNTTTLPGTRVRGEGDPPSNDAAVDEAYDGSGDTYDLYNDVYGRNSLDGNGMRLDSTVHYGQGYDNAFWNGQQMAYGDGDEDLPQNERLFNRFTRSLDVIGHELTHGVTQFAANLEYRNQPGALNESFSDVFGSLVRQRKRGETAADADWLIGADLLTSNVNGQGIRSMKAPGTAYDDPVLGRDPQPAHMNGYVNTTSDNGGVHINSGIPNHAFYRLAVDLGGSAWERAGLIWYRTLIDSRLSTTASFQACADLTYTIAGEAYGAGSSEQLAVQRAWDGVGITVGSTAPPPPPPPPPPGGDGRGCLVALLTFGAIH